MYHCTISLFRKEDYCNVCAWRSRPTIIDNWPGDIDKIIAIDENGTCDLNSIKKIFKNDSVKLLKAYKDTSKYMHERWFTITGVVLKKVDFPNFKEEVNAIKYRHWDNGIYDYKSGKRRVVFHSREIRRKEGPFNPKVVDYAQLQNDISLMIKSTDFRIYSSSIDKINHVFTYSKPFHVYNLNLNFIIERFCWELNRNNESGIILLESRGKKEDLRILRYLTNLIDNGNNFKSKEHFSGIKGVYFNPKWCLEKNKGKASYILLELADVVSYPIFKYTKTNNKDKAFLTFEDKIYNYPYYNGYGLKKFP